MLKTHLFWSSLIAVVLIGFGGCKSSVPDFELQEIDPRVVLEFQLSNGEDPVKLNEQFTDAMGYTVKITEAKYFLSDIELVTTSGDAELLRDVELFNHLPVDESLDSPQWANAYKISVPPGEYGTINFGVGVRSDLNSQDPTTLPNEDPLSLYGGMHWTWATMYKFIVLHAKVDTLGGSNITHDVTYETGLDSLYRGGLQFPVNLSLESFDRDTLRFVIDWNDLWDGAHLIDLKSENVTHTFGTVEDAQLAVRFTDNFVAAIKRD